MSASSKPKEVLRSFEFTLPDGTKMLQTTEELGFNTLWTVLSANADFLLRFMEAYRPYTGKVPLSTFRCRFLGLCYDRRVVTGDKALPLFGEFSEWCSKAWMN